MPTKRKLRTRNLRPEIGAFEYWLMCPEIYLEPPDGAGRAFFELAKERERRALWESLREEVLAAFVARRPGTRPQTWWTFDAPRAPDAQLRLWQLGPDWWLWKLEHRPCEPRLRLGGIGTPACECTATTPDLSYGVPGQWVEDWIMREHFSPEFKGVPIDPLDPPCFESQASYLRRHGLFLPGELKRLAETDFEPEIVAP